MEAVPSQSSGDGVDELAFDTLHIMGNAKQEEDLNALPPLQHIFFPSNEVNAADLDSENKKRPEARFLCPCGIRRERLALEAVQIAERDLEISGKTVEEAVDGMEHIASLLLQVIEEHREKLREIRDADDEITKPIIRKMEKKYKVPSPTSSTKATCSGFVV